MAAVQSQIIFSMGIECLPPDIRKYSTSATCHHPLGRPNNTVTFLFGYLIPLPKSSQRTDIYGTRILLGRFLHLRFDHKIRHQGRLGMDGPAYFRILHPGPHSFRLFALGTHCFLIRSDQRGCRVSPFTIIGLHSSHFFNIQIPQPSPAIPNAPGSVDINPLLNRHPPIGFRPGRR